MTKRSADKNIMMKGSFYTRRSASVFAPHARSSSSHSLRPPSSIHDPREPKEVTSEVSEGVNGERRRWGEAASRK